MAQWWLYKCECCGVAIFSNEDHGTAWYTTCCGTCRMGMYHDKMKMYHDRNNMFDDEYQFLEAKNDSQETKKEE